MRLASFAITCLDKKPAVLNWLDEKNTGYQIENDFSTISKDDICIL